MHSMQMRPIFLLCMQLNKVHHRMHGETMSQKRYFTTHFNVWLSCWPNDTAGQVRSARGWCRDARGDVRRLQGPEMSLGHNHTSSAPLGAPLRDLSVVTTAHPRLQRLP